MKLEHTFLRSQVARRILGLFVICAIVPAGASLWVTYEQTKERDQQTRRERLRQESKLAAEQILERIRLIAAEFDRSTERLQRSSPAEWTAAADSANSRLTGLALEVGLGERFEVFGSPPDPPPLPDVMRERLESGGTVAATVEAASGEAEVLLVRQIAVDGEAALAWGLVDMGRISRETSSLSESVEACLIDHRRRPIFCNLTLPDSLYPGSVDLRTTAEGAYLRWQQDDEEVLAAWALVFLTADFAAPPWVAITGEAAVLPAAEVGDLRLSTLYAVVIALVTVILLSSVQIRRSLAPLERLHEGTQRVADGNLFIQVDVDSGDEFEDLAHSFNEMVGQIRTQFRTLESLRQIDRTVLSEPDLGAVARTGLEQTKALLDCAACLLLVRGRARTRYATGFLHRGDPGDLTVLEAVDLEMAHLSAFKAEELTIQPVSEGPRCLTALRELDPHGYLVNMAIEHREVTIGILAATFTERPDLTRIGGPMTQIVDQLGVALANVRLVKELDELSLGALRALARTVDANSRWTAGHSERVTRLAGALGVELGLEQAELDRLYRGGLLHDIGKLGVSESILDSAGAPTPEQWEMIRKHPEIGARILAPIEAFDDVVPIVLCHHEKWNGEGYPRGLAGTDIPYLARVLAVADVFDALTSDRPYRLGYATAEAVRMIEGEAGSHFDASIVEVLRPALATLGHDLPPATAESAAPEPLTEQIA